MAALGVLGGRLMQRVLAPLSGERKGTHCAAMGKVRAVPFVRSDHNKTRPSPHRSNSRIALFAWPAFCPGALPASNCRSRKIENHYIDGVAQLVRHTLFNSFLKPDGRCNFQIIAVDNLLVCSKPQHKIDALLSGMWMNHVARCQLRGGSSVQLVMPLTFDFYHQKTRATVDRCGSGYVATVRIRHVVFNHNGHVQSSEPGFQQVHDTIPRRVLIHMPVFRVEHFDRIGRSPLQLPLHLAQNLHNKSTQILHGSDFVLVEKFHDLPWPWRLKTSQGSPPRCRCPYALCIIVKISQANIRKNSVHTADRGCRIMQAN